MCVAVFVYVCMCVCVYVCEMEKVFVYVCMCVCVSQCSWMCYMCVAVFVYVCLCVCGYVCEAEEWIRERILLSRALTRQFSLSKRHFPLSALSFRAPRRLFLPLITCATVRMESQSTCLSPRDPCLSLSLTFLSLSVPVRQCEWSPKALVSLSH